ncbi:hypothetical protein BD779DRAFT_1496630 [Infundibulicybe gibba]|nr:hypothetical protein BD779DRAFT_1496630 [Infundibulicybe gibba]
MEICGLLFLALHPMTPPRSISVPFKTLGCTTAITVIHVLEVPPWSLVGIVFKFSPIDTIFVARFGPNAIFTIGRTGWVGATAVRAMTTPYLDPS